MLETDTFTRIMENLAQRTTGPLHFRLLLQPAMALMFGVRDGIKDAREGQPLYFWGLFTDRRRDLLRSGWSSIGKVFIVAVIIDAVYQFIELRWFYPLEALIVAFILAAVPYVLIRGPVNRWLRAKRRRQADFRRAA